MTKEFEAKTICILGRQPALGLAELESVYGSGHVKPGPQSTALLDIDGFEINFKNLGGTIKVARVLADIPSVHWPECLSYLKEKVPQNLNLEDGKFTLGVSLYGFDATPGKINRDLISLKKTIKSAGFSSRIVPNKQPALSSAQVLHNKLTRRGSSELLLVKNGDKTILAQTIFVQDIDAYSARDQARPARDARVGMLPPKLAQIILNLSQPEKNAIILDPFCGSGVVLQEALLMGFDVVGTDIDRKMVDFSDKNLDWLAQRHEIGKYKLGLADATSFKWPKFDTVASEVYLGRPFSSLPEKSTLKSVITDVNTITKKFLINLRSQIKPSVKFCIAVPSWIDGKRVIRLPLIDQLTDVGYNRYDLVHVRSEDLLYFREGQTVARELLILEKVK